MPAAARSSSFARYFQKRVPSSPCTGSVWAAIAFTSSGIRISSRPISRRSRKVARGRGPRTIPSSSSVTRGGADRVISRRCRTMAS